MDPKSTAVVLIEYQNDFTTEGGTLHGAVKTVMDKTNMLANTVETVKRARTRRDHCLRADHVHRGLS
jgi:ureidoacrylate peracid hydrolase